MGPGSSLFPGPPTPSRIECKPMPADVFVPMATRFCGPELVCLRMFEIEMVGGINAIDYVYALCFVCVHLCQHTLKTFKMFILRAAVADVMPVAIGRWCAGELAGWAGCG